MKHLKRFENFRYVDLKSNLYEFFENILGEEPIINLDKTTIIIELPFNVTGKEDWYEKFKQLCTEFDYDDIYIKDNIINLSRSFGVIDIPNAYNSFDW